MGKIFLTRPMYNLLYFRKVVMQGLWVSLPQPVPVRRNFGTVSSLDSVELGNLIIQQTVHRQIVERT